jgi:hypothetical protein
MGDIAYAKLTEAIVDRAQFILERRNAISDALEELLNLCPVVAAPRHTEFARSNFTGAQIIGHRGTIPRRGLNQRYLGKAPKKGN